MIPTISMLKIQELPGAMPLDSHRGTTLGSHGLSWTTWPALPPPNTPSGSGLISMLRTGHKNVQILVDSWKSPFPTEKHIVGPLRLLEIN